MEQGVAQRIRKLRVCIVYGRRQGGDVLLQCGYLSAMPSAPSSPISFRAELLRKGLHGLAVVLPLGVLLWEEQLRIPLLVLAALAIGGDIARARSIGARRWLHRVFGTLMRPEEMPPLGGPIVLNGATWMCVAAAFCTAVFSPAIAAAALAIQMLGDGAAALVGRRFGRTRLGKTSKTMEGSVAFLAVAFVAACVVAQWPGAELGVLACSVGALVGAVVESLPLQVNDNISVPLASAAAMLLFA